MMVVRTLKLYGAYRKLNRLAHKPTRKLVQQEAMIQKLNPSSQHPDQQRNHRGSVQ